MMKCENQPFDIEEKVRMDCYNRGYEQGRKNPAEEIVEYIEKLQKQVKEYQDKIEQGTLIELPCKVGDDVYFVVQHEEDWVMEIGYVISISIDKEGIWISCRYSSGLSYWHNIKDSDVFFNANKANEKLKELQNGN